MVLQRKQLKISLINNVKKLKYYLGRYKKHTKKQKKVDKKMSDNFLKIIKDSGLSQEEVLKMLEEQGKIKSPATYAEIYKVEEAKRLEKEKLEKEKAEKDKQAPAPPATPPITPPATPPIETPAVPPETPPAVDPLDKKFEEMEARLTKLIAEGSVIPRSTPSPGESSEKKKDDDFSLALTGKYEKYI